MKLISYSGRFQQADGGQLEDRAVDTLIRARKLDYTSQFYLFSRLQDCIMKEIDLTVYNLNCLCSGVTLYQGAPGSKFSKAQVERRICSSFLGGPGHAHPENF